MTAPVTTASGATLGATSSESMGVSIDKLLQVRLLGLDDVSFGSAGYADSDMTASTAFCVYSSTGAIALTLSSSNATGTILNMSNGASGPSGLMPYQVSLLGNPLESGVPVSGLTATSLSDVCSGVDNATIELTVLANDFNSAAAGSYADTLTLFIEPE